MRVTCFVLFLLAGVAHAGPEDSECRVRHNAGPFIDSGSGTVIWSDQDTSYVLTAWHVVPDDRSWIRIVHRGKEYPARRFAFDANVDIACLEVKASLPAVKIAKADPAIDETLHQWGHPHAVEKAVHKTGGIVRFLRMDGYDRLLTRAAVEEGDSGCGVFDTSGRLVGVCIAVAKFPGGHHEQCVRLADVRKFLKLDE
jgi:S1-C subfamily serine protease